jgi:hypothetical protein
LDLSVSDSKLLTFEVTQSWFSGARHDTTARACSRPPQQRQHAHGKATAKSAVRSEKATRQEIAPVKPTQEGGRTGQTQRHADARLPPHRPYRTTNSRAGTVNGMSPGALRTRSKPALLAEMSRRWLVGPAGFQIPSLAALVSSVRRSFLPALPSIRRQGLASVGSVCAVHKRAGKPLDIASLVRTRE